MLLKFWCWVWQCPKEPARSPDELPGSIKEIKWALKARPRRPKTPQGRSKVVTLWSFIHMLPIVSRLYKQNKYLGSRAGIIYIKKHLFGVFRWDNILYVYMFPKQSLLYGVLTD